MSLLLDIYIYSPYLYMYLKVTLLIHRTHNKAPSPPRITTVKKQNKPVSKAKTQENFPALTTWRFPMNLRWILTTAVYSLTSTLYKVYLLSIYFNSSSGLVSAHNNLFWILCCSHFWFQFYFWSQQCILRPKRQTFYCFLIYSGNSLLSDLHPLHGRHFIDFCLNSDDSNVIFYVLYCHYFAHHFLLKLITTIN